MCYADCVPIYFLAPKQQRIGIVHSGWKGTVQKIAGEMAAKWLSDGIDPTELLRPLDLLSAKIVIKWMIVSFNKSMPFYLLTTTFHMLKQKKGVINWI